MSTTTPRSSAKTRLRELRAELILDSAEKILLDKGYHNTSMDEVAARTGVAKGTLYQHFPSKDDLVFALIERYLRLCEQVVEQAALANMSPRARLERILDASFRELEGPATRLFRLLQPDRELRAILFEKREQLRWRLDRLMGHLRTLLEEGKAQGDFDPTISTDLMLTVVMSLFSFPRKRIQATPQGRSATEDLLVQAKRLLFDGIAAHHSEGV
jgi:TetR/AcrR family fatty acid metabolism transcriptional regulator